MCGEIFWRSSFRRVPLLAGRTKEVVPLLADPGIARTSRQAVLAGSAAQAVAHCLAFFVVPGNLTAPPRHRLLQVIVP